MPGAQDVAAQLQQALDTAARCASDETTQNYDALSQDLADLEELAKGVAAGHADCRALLAKLRAGTTLSADDLDALRLMVVGDAAYYVKYDEELDRCRDEVRRIVGEMQQLQSGEMGVDALMHLSVLAREARAMLELTRHYFDSRDRLRRFQTATAGTLDADSRRALITVVEDVISLNRG